MFVTRRKVCILWKLEGEIRVSEKEIPSEFERWNTTRARRKTFSIVSVAARARARVRHAFEKKQLCVCYIWSD